MRERHFDFRLLMASKLIYFAVTSFQRPLYPLHCYVLAKEGYSQS